MEKLIFLEKIYQMQNLLISNLKCSVLNSRSIRFYTKQFRYATSSCYTQLSDRQFSSDVKFRKSKKISLFLPVRTEQHLLVNLNRNQTNLIYRLLSTNAESTNNNKIDETTGDDKKKPTKFKQLYTQYGPLFVVVHLITVVMWIYGFFLISKQ